MTGKRTKAINAKVDAEKLYSAAEAIKTLKECSKTKFVETIDVAVVLGIDVKQSDQNIRGMLVLPHGTGKSIRVAVLAKGPKAEEAKKAGADIVGENDLADLIMAGTINFDRLIATPDLMPLVGKLGKVLGPKGLMPNPKLGTVTMDVTKAVTEAKAGSIEFRAEKAGIVHCGIAKVNMTEAQIAENLKALLDALLKAKPQNIKGVYFKKATLSSTMGPGLKLDISEYAAAANTVKAA